MMWRVYGFGVLLLLLGGVLAQAQYIGPTRQGLSFHLSAVPDELYLPNDVISNEAGPDLFPTESTLTVHVLDAQQKPVKGIPVTFNLTPGCESVAMLKPVRAVTSEDGMAHATVEADERTGLCRIAVQVDNVTQTIRILVSPAPSEASEDQGGHERGRKR